MLNTVQSKHRVPIKRSSKMTNDQSRALLEDFLSKNKDLSVLLVNGSDVVPHYPAFKGKTKGEFIDNAKKIGYLSEVGLSKHDLGAFDRAQLVVGTSYPNWGLAAVSVIEAHRASLPIRFMSRSLTVALIALAGSALGAGIGSAFGGRIGFGAKEGAGLGALSGLLVGLTVDSIKRMKAMDKEVIRRVQEALKSAGFEGQDPHSEEYSIIVNTFHKASKDMDNLLTSLSERQHKVDNPEPTKIELTDNTIAKFKKNV